MKKLFIKNLPLILILLLGVFLRTYKALELFAYAHDQDLAAWIVRDIIFNKHIRLIGQETSTQGIFIGSLYYYLQVPFYLISKMQPPGLIIIATLLGIFTILSFYFVFLKTFNKKIAGLIAAFIYSVSFFCVMNDRGTVPTTPVFLWTVWYLYGLVMLLRKNQRNGFILIGTLSALIWHINFSLAILLILIPLAIYLSGVKVNLKRLLPGLLLFAILSLPLFVFEFKHGYIQSKALINSFINDQGSSLTLIQQSRKVIYIFEMLISNIVWWPGKLYYFLIPLVILFASIYIYIRKKIPGQIFWLFVCWSIPVLVFFSFYSKIVSEYYLNGIIVAWIGLITSVVLVLYTYKKTRIFAIIALTVFAFINITKILKYSDNKDGYIYRRVLVAEIRRDSEEHNFPCVAVSYITKPGYNLGYRYLYVLEALHVNNPDSLSPVYTIVFPLNDELFPTDKTFGSLGLIYPDYPRYNTAAVQKSCSGENSNLTDPMFGFTN